MAFVELLYKKISQGWECCCTDYQHTLIPSSHHSSHSSPSDMMLHNYKFEVTAQ